MRNSWLAVLAISFVVGSSYTMHCEKKEWSYEVRKSTLCVYDEIVGEYSESIAQDMAEALNQAHERRTMPTYGIRTFPCNGSDCDSPIIYEQFLDLMKDQETLIRMRGKTK